METHLLLIIYFLQIDSTVCCMFLRATSGLMASSNDMNGGLTEKTPSNPACCNSSESSMLPANRITGIFCFRASASMPEGTFPINVCRSAFPSPVMIRSALFILLLKSRASSISCMPGFSSAFRKASRLPPIPPAAPAPG